MSHHVDKMLGKIPGRWLGMQQALALPCRDPDDSAASERRRVQNAFPASTRGQADRRSWQGAHCVPCRKVLFFLSAGGIIQAGQLLFAVHMLVAVLQHL